MPEIEPKDKTLKTLEGIHLWHAPMSSCSQRVRIVLAETNQQFESHLINIGKDEHATEEYQSIHPKGLVPALVNEGHLFTESIDIIQHITGEHSDLFKIASQELLKMADDAQQDLKLLTFEFLFRAGPPPNDDAVQAFQKTHHNEWLKQFRTDFASGFAPDRIREALRATEHGFEHLNNRLSDGRKYLDGESFSLSDVAWMPNVHRFNLMAWPFEQTPYLKTWFDTVSRRSSYKSALMDWQAEGVASTFEAYTTQRQAQGTDVRSFLAELK